ncbi:helix-turn-helix domain-containing protein [Curvivirga sp.]|uniref:helix-turn-helix domain-containing protein n=1 Tax=Curvivirga sp. TaxID=2856848 RepID=UPI003B5B6BF8
MRPEEADIFQALQKVGAYSPRSVDLGQGFSMASWENAGGYAVYEKPNHHTLSFYLRGGKGTRRHYSPYRTTDHGYPGAICLMPAGITSEWSIESKFHFIHLYFKEDYFNKIIEENFDLDSRLVELKDLTYDTDPLIQNLCRDVITPLNWDSAADQMSISNASQLMIQHLMRHYTNRQAAISPIKGGLAPYLLKQVKDYVEASLEQNITIDDLAGEVNLSSFHFARMFKTSMNEAPHQYVLSRRVAKVKELLGESELALSEIALKCGFSSQAHMSTRFKEKTGITPLQFRKLS